MKCKQCGKKHKKSCSKCSGTSHNKAARKSEGSILRQKLRMKFGRNRAKKQIMKSKKKSPCWKGYKMVGLKIKGSRKVPNCVPSKKVKKK